MVERRDFTATEIRGLLPGGWNLADPADPGSWDGSGRRWRTGLLDSADVRREVAVDAGEIDRHGRLEALRRAVDRVYREALG